LVTLTVPIQDTQAIEIPIEDNGENINVTIAESGTDINLVFEGGISTSNFIKLSDTPSSYSGQGGKILIVNDNEDSLEFTTELDNKISLDGTTTTTDLIPFAEGISVLNNKKVSLSDDNLSYLIFNSITNKIELFVNNVKKASWG
jgi:hypothetical protein